MQPVLRPHDERSTGRRSCTRRSAPASATCSSRHATCHTRGQSRSISRSANAAVVYRSFGTKPSAPTSIDVEVVSQLQNRQRSGSRAVQHRRPVRAAWPTRSRRARRSSSGVDPPHVRRARRPSDPARGRARPRARRRPRRPRRLLTSATAVEHVEAMLACYKLRAVPINVNYRYVGGRARVPVRRRRRRRRRARRRVARPVDVASRPRPASRARRRRATAYERVIADGVTGRRDFGPRSPDDHYMLYTGGTTGMPRASCGGRRTSSSRRSAAGTRAVRRSSARRTIVASVVDNPAQRVAPVPRAGRSRPDAVRLAVARAADARERPVVGARHVARRRQGRAVRPSRTST